MLSPSRNGWRDIVRRIDEVPASDHNDWRAEDRAQYRERRDAAVRRYREERAAQISRVTRDPSR